MFVHHEKVPHDLLFRFAHLALMLRRLYQHEVHRVGINCHALALVLAPPFKFKAVHGHVAGLDNKKKSVEFQRHSWLVSDGYIVDPKPNACVAFSPLLIRTTDHSPFAALYFPAENKRSQPWLRSKKTRVGVDHLRRAFADIVRKDPVSKEDIVQLLAYGAPS